MDEELLNKFAYGEMGTEDNWVDVNIKRIPRHDHLTESEEEDPNEKVEPTKKRELLSE